MKERVLQSAALLFAACGFAPQAFADSELLDADSRYQKLTQMPAADQLGNYYFILTDKEQDLMMTRGAGVDQAREQRTWWYMNSADPTTDLSRVWLIEANTTNNATNGYSFKSVLEPGKYMQTENNAAFNFHTHDNGGGDASWYQFLFAYDTEGAYWTFENGKYPMTSPAQWKGFIGPWGNMIEHGAEVAANKNVPEHGFIGHFTIYAITKQNFALAKVDNVYGAVLENSTATDDVRTAYETAIATAKSEIEGAAGDEAAWETALNTLETARQTYVLAATPREGTTFDVSFLIQDAAVTGVESAWTNTNYAGPEHLYAGAPDDKFFDITERTIAQELSGLRAGTYRLTAATRAMNANGAAISLNDASATVENVGDRGNALCSGWGLTTTRDVLIEDGAATVAFQSTSGWANADNFKLEYVSDVNTGLRAAKEAALAEIESAYQPIYDNSMDGEARTTYGNVLESAKTAINEATAIDVIEAALATLEPARQAYVVAGVPNAGYTFDVTFLMANPAVSDQAATGWTNGHAGWDQQYTGAPDNCYLDGNNATVNNIINMYQVVSNLRPGVYRLTAATRGESHVANGYIYLNDAKAPITQKNDAADAELGDGWEWTTTPEVAIFGGEAKIGFYANCTNDQTVTGTGYVWAGADDFKLAFVRELTDADREVTVDVTVTEAGWATLMLPFAADVPAGLTAYTCEGVTAQEDGTTSLDLVAAASLAAHTPYILQGAADAYSFSGTVEGTPGNQHEAGLLVGTYVPMAAEVGSYVLQNQEAGVGFYKVAAGAQPLVNAYRVYLKADEALANAQMLSLDFNGGVTGIGTATVAGGDTLVDVYSLSGVLVRKGVAKGEALNGLQKGIYVVDGVKVAVK